MFSKYFSLFIGFNSLLWLVFGFIKSRSSGWRWAWWVRVVFANVWSPNRCCNSILYCEFTISTTIPQSSFISTCFDAFLSCVLSLVGCLGDCGCCLCQLKLMSCSVLLAIASLCAYRLSGHVWRHWRQCREWRVNNRLTFVVDVSAGATSQLSTAPSCFLNFNVRPFRFASTPSRYHYER